MVGGFLTVEEKRDDAATGVAGTEGAVTTAATAEAVRAWVRRELAADVWEERNDAAALETGTAGC